MNITTTKEGTTVTAALEGRLDTTTSAQLSQWFEENLTSAEHVVLDLKGLEYVSSAGLRVLLTAQKKMKGPKGLVLRSVNAEVMEVFEMTGFADILTIE